MKSTLFDLSGKVAVVTGASRGIGRAIAIALSEHGARVAVSSRKIAKCEEVVGEIRAGGGEAVAVACNIASRPDLENLVAVANRDLGPVNILVCNAAVNPYYGSSLEMPDEAFDKVMACNIRSNVWLCNMVLPGMAMSGGGSVIIVSSIGGFLGSDVLGAYSISKAADMQLARNIAVEWGHKNIRCNCIAPGLIKTDFARALWENPKVLGKALETTPLRRLGDPQEIAGAAVFLASRAGSYMSGQTIVIDGGRLAGPPRLN